MEVKTFKHRQLPREDVAVSPEEVDERVFLFGVETRPDGVGLAAVACLELAEAC
jgi:hypothetical protein